jgi:peroxiredoxin Q/BCP
MAKKTVKKAAVKTAAPKSTGLKKAAKKAAVAKKTTAAQPAVKPVKKAAKAAPAVESLLKVGQKAPAFTLMNHAGQKVTLKDFAGKKLVIYFYPKDDTPGCTKESCDFRDQFEPVKKAGAVVIGVSKDSVASHLKFKTKYSLPFDLLSDEEGKMCEAYGVWKEKSMYGRKYMGIERTTFIVDESGKIAKIYPKVSVTGHVDEVLKDLQ